MQLVGRRYDTGQLCLLETDRGRIARLEAIPAAGEQQVHAAPWIAPGFFDIQVNGYGGREFCSAELTPDEVDRISRQIPRFGVTRYLPTVTTQSPEVLLHAMATIAEACRRDTLTDRLVAGIHLEGPYISPEDGARGAHPLPCCRNPDWDEFQRLQDAAEGRIRLLTLAPELDGAIEFIRRLSQSGVCVALGHLAADVAQIQSAVDAGARMSTHLGNGAHRQLPRHPNYLWEQIAEDRLAASLIVDGHHLPASVVKTIVRTKGVQQCVLVSDLSGLAGLPPGRYPSQLCDLEILDDGRLVIAGQRQLLAGASAPIAVGIGGVMRQAGLTLAQAVDMASRQPAALVGAPVYELQVGQPADIVLLEPFEEQSPEIRVRQTIVADEAV